MTSCCWPSGGLAALRPWACAVTQWADVRIRRSLAVDGTGISPEVVEELRGLARRHGLASLVLFGSRARGDHSPKSDIDLAIFGGDYLGFALDADEATSTLLSFDFVDADGLRNDELRTRIAQEGVVLYEEAR